MSDRSHMLVRVRTADLPKFRPALDLDDDYEGEVDGESSLITDEEVVGGGELYIEPMLALRLPFIINGDPHYTYDGFVAFSDGEHHEKEYCGNSGISGLLFVPKAPLPGRDQQAKRLTDFADRFTEVEEALIAGTEIQPDSRPPAEAAGGCSWGDIVGVAYGLPEFSNREPDESIHAMRIWAWLDAKNDFDIEWRLLHPKLAEFEAHQGFVRLAHMKQVADGWDVTPIDARGESSHHGTMPEAYAAVLKLRSMA